MFFILSKSSFCSRDTKFFVFPSSSSFSSCGHCHRGCLKINVEFYDVINCLNKNLITHFVWYLANEKKYDIETLSIDRVLNKEDFYGEFMHKMCTKPHFKSGK